MVTILRTNNLCKSYGNKKALSDVNIELQEGKVLGVLGPNGSGKTTLLKILANLHQKTSGEVTICGEEPSIKTKAFVSFLPDRNYLYKWMRIRDAKDFYNDFFADFNKTTFYELLKFMELDEDLKITALSKGMQEKLNLSLCLSRDAKLYILDEPIGGVDPLARDMILNTIIDKAFEKKTLIVTTQLVRDIETIFDECLFLSNGEVLKQGGADEIREEYGSSIEDVFKELYRGAVC